QDARAQHSLVDVEARRLSTHLLYPSTRQGQTALGIAHPRPAQRLRSVDLHAPLAAGSGRGDPLARAREKPVRARPRRVPGVPRAAAGAVWTGRPTATAHEGRTLPALS